MYPKGPEGEKPYEKIGRKEKIYRLWEHEWDEERPVEEKWLGAYLSFKEVANKLSLLEKEIKTAEDRDFIEKRILAFQKQIDRLLDELKKINEDFDKIKRQ